MPQSALSQFSGLWTDALDGLSALHGQPILFRQDRRADATWVTIMASKIELNIGELDREGRRIAASGERLFGHFLIERRFLATDGSGQLILPGEFSEVQHDGWIYRASKSNERPICMPEDHECLLYRFRTTQQERAD